MKGKCDWCGRSMPDSQLFNTSRQSISYICEYCLKRIESITRLAP